MNKNTFIQDIKQECYSQMKKPLRSFIKGIKDGKREMEKESYNAQIDELLAEWSVTKSFMISQLVYIRDPEYAANFAINASMDSDYIIDIKNGKYNWIHSSGKKGFSVFCDVICEFCEIPDGLAVILKENMKVFG